MTNIGKVDQIVLQLRAQLQRVASQRARPAGGASKSEASSLQRFKALEAANGYSDRGLRRRFIRALLTEELGEELANQPEFERISDEVWRMIEEDQGLALQLSDALRQLNRG